jgi:hypoxanthine phosphoribosyltransferase
MGIRNEINLVINALNGGGRLLMPKKAIDRVFYRNPNFVSNVDMAADVDAWVKSFETRYDLIVGVPRSGLMIATLIATKLGKPLSTTDNIIWRSKSVAPRPIKNILVVEDCVSTGKSLEAAVVKVRELYPDAVVHKGVLYATDRLKAGIDTYFGIINGIQIFQWNIMHYKFGIIGFDMDGVLCEACSNDKDEDAYLRFLTTARPYLIPEYEIDYIITSRLEKYRPQTEKWLKDNGVKYKNLIMWDLPDKSDRDGAGAYKSKVINHIQIRYFIEDNVKFAEEIWKTTRIPCLCTDEMRMFG